MKATGWPNGVKRGLFLTQDLLNGIFGRAEPQMNRRVAAQTIHTTSKRTTVFISYPAQAVDTCVHLSSLIQQTCHSAGVDWRDPQLNPLMDPTVARTARSQIKQAQKFIWILSADSMRSVWQHWELGWADAHKTRMDMALFPILSGYDAVALPYLLNYNRIVLDPHARGGQGSIVVVGPDDLHIDLYRWLEP